MYMFFYLPFMGVMSMMTVMFFFVISYFWVSNIQCLLLDWTLLSLNGLDLKLPIFLDSFSLCFGATVSVISSGVFYFSSSYMIKEKYFIRFHLLVFLFIVSMFFLIYSPNLVSLLLGWDGLGVTSYLLIIYFNSSKSFNAGFLTALSNRVGDCFLLIAIGMFLSNFTFNLYLWSSEMMISNSLTLFIIFFSLATITKSAQIPFSAWLPAAMAAPTPVSALVHSSTLVTAGVYLLVRFGLMLGNLKKMIFILGLLTMIMAGLSALSETDMKKIVALSTLSQLGLMMSAVGISAFQLAFFHLLSHAFFKALLFMSVGNFIHLSGNNQDLRTITLPLNKMGVTLSFSLIANTSLMGFPFMSGFYSKDLIMEKTLFESLSVLEASLMLLSIGLTVLYTFRFLAYVFWSSMNSANLSWAQDADSNMEKGMTHLWGLAIFGGSFLSWSLLKTPNLFILPSSSKHMILIIIVSFLLLALNAYKPSFNERPKAYSWSLGSLWALPFISGRMNMKMFTLGMKTYKNLDLTWSVSPLSLPQFLGKELDTFHLSSFNFSESVIIFTLIFITLLLY